MADTDPDADLVLAIAEALLDRKMRAVREKALDFMRG